jgi:uncharacterized protein YceK
MGMATEMEETIMHKIIPIYVLLIILFFLLTGCATYYNSQDPCQTANKPTYCFKADKRLNIYDDRGNRTGYVKENGGY